MTSDALAHPRRPPGWRRLPGGNAAPIVVIVAALLAVWYLAAVLMNAPLARDAFEREQTAYGVSELLTKSLNMERPLLPAPHQIVGELVKSVVDYPPTSNRSLVFHSWVTLSATVLGFAIGAVFGVVLAVLIVYVRTLEKSLLPWIISSQTVPILAIAPIVIVVLGSIGLRGLLPKSIISAYLSFFPVTVGMVKGLNSPDPMQRDLMRTWSATGAQIFRKLRWPASVPFLFASLKVAIAISLVGAIVAELPTGAQGGIGARLLAGSYYGQTVQIWAALFAAGLLAASLVGLTGLAERIVIRRMGGRP
ncbi:MAG: ABC transporter permease [Hyphomicrobiales bacterium]|nr:ABC transporter permease [Hyphomicrobiales bacterium]